MADAANARVRYGHVSRWTDWHWTDPINSQRAASSAEEAGFF